MFWPYLSSDAQNPAHQHLQEQQLLQLIQPNPIGPTHTPLFVFYTDRYVNFSRPKQLLYDTANKAGLEVTVERVFTQRDGTPVIEVVSLTPTATGRPPDLYIPWRRRDNPQARPHGG